MFEVFPTNGLDRSILSPVFVGLIFAAVFKEAFGWPLVALVVPGYLATLFVAAPLSGFAIVAEAMLTYLVARAVGRSSSHLFCWST